MTRSALVLVSSLLLCGLPASAQTITLRPANGTADGDFTQIVGLRELRDGRLLVADRGENRLTVVGWGGGEPVEVGRKGKGPGEYQAVRALHPLGGDSTVMLDPVSTRWFLFDGARIVGAIAPTSFPNTVLTTIAGADRTGRVMGPVGFSDAGAPTALPRAHTQVLLVADRQAQRIDTIARFAGVGSHPVIRLPATAKSPMTIVTASILTSTPQGFLFNDGWIAVTHVEPYRVDWRSPRGEWIRGRPLPNPPVRVDAQEKCAAWKRMFLDTRPCDHAAIPDWPEKLPPFEISVAPTLFSDAAGRLIVRRTPSARSSSNVYDVIDRRGELVGRLTLRADQEVVGFGTASAYVATRDEMGLHRIRRHPWP